MDREFLKSKAYPWIRDVAIFLDQLSITGSDGKRKLPISSSPEIFDNSSKAWFPEISNFDLALIRWTFTKAAELAHELNLNDEAEKWESILTRWPDFSVDEKTGFMFTKNIFYDQSHRHFSHLMAFHPLGLVDYSQGERSIKTIDSTLSNLIKVGPDWWCGYSYSWLGNLYARAMKGEEAADALRTFATCFCLPNSFHVNGDQSKTGKSKMTYRPFTLEGNFAFASGLQEMLIQSHTGVVQIFPAVPSDWKMTSFSNLRTEGAFLVSAVKDEGAIRTLTVNSTAGGTIKILNSFRGSFSLNLPYQTKDNLIIVEMDKDQTAVLTAANSEPGKK
jgi:alpha-L-fucosidase 2